MHPSKISFNLGKGYDLSPDFVSTNGASRLPSEYAL